MFCLILNEWVHSECTKYLIFSETPPNYVPAMISICYYNIIKCLFVLIYSTKIAHAHLQDRKIEKYMLDLILDKSHLAANTHLNLTAVRSFPTLPIEQNMSKPTKTR